MIKQIRVVNWKSFADATLYIDPVTILIGPNASGKSNLLEVLVFLSRIGQGIEVSKALMGDEHLPEIRGGLEGACRYGSKSFEIETVIGIEGSAEYKHAIEVQVTEASAFISRELVSLLKTGDNENKVVYSQIVSSYDVSEKKYKHKLTDAKGVETDAPFKLNTQILPHYILFVMNTGQETQPFVDHYRHIVNAFKAVFVFEPHPSRMRGYAKLSGQLQRDGANVAGVLAALPQSKKEAIEQQITAFVSQLPERDIQHIWTETVGRLKTDAMLYCREGWQGSETQVIDVRGMSDGTLRYLAIVAALLTRTRGSLLVIEEIDNGLHPSRAKFLVEMLLQLAQERGVDVLVTTHNPALLDAAGIDMLPFITVAHRDLNSGASKLTLLEDLKQLPKLMAQGSIGQLSTAGEIEQTLHESEA